MNDRNYMCNINIIHKVLSFCRDSPCLFNLDHQEVKLNSFEEIDFENVNCQI